MSVLDQQVAYQSTAFGETYYGLEDTQIRSRYFDFMVQNFFFDFFNPKNLLRIHLTSQVQLRNLQAGGPAPWTPPPPYADHPQAPQVVTVLTMLQQFNENIWGFQTNLWKNEDEWDLQRFWAYMIVTVHRLTSDDTKYVHVANDLSQIRKQLLSQIVGILQHPNATIDHSPSQMEFLEATGNLVHQGHTIPAPARL